MRSPPPGEQVALAGERRALVDRVLQRGPVLVLDPLEQREPIFDLLQLRGRRIDPVGVAAQEERQVFELRLDPVAGIDVRRKLRIDDGQLADTLPDAAEPAQHRVVALVQRRVALFAEPLDALGVGQHPAGGRELLVLPRPWRRLFDLPELKGNQVEARRLFAAVHPRSFELLSKGAQRRPRVGHALPPRT